MKNIIPFFARNRITLILLSCCLSGINTARAEDNDDYYFDPSLIRGNTLTNSALQTFNTRNAVPPGVYKVDLLINDQFIAQIPVTFKDDQDGKISACLTPEQIRLTGLKEEPALSGDTECYFPAAIGKNITSRFNNAELKLNLTIPQAMLSGNRQKRIPQESLDSGETMLFANYNANQYHVSYTDSRTRDMNSTYLSLNGGFNLGLWSFRQESQYNWSDSTGGKWNTSRRYIQRALYEIGSKLLIGEGFTSGNFLSGMGFKGVSLSTDERMLPDNERGYAPRIQGIANSNAKVTVWQGNQQIYSVTVAPGPFEINDLYSTNYAGDLRVEVTEADGSVNSFIVPFSAVPESVRPGSTKYSVTAGKTRFTGSNDNFSEVVIQHGLTNQVTLNAAGQVAKGYQAILLGGVHTNRFGAFSINATLSNAKLPGTTETGWRFHASYSKTFQPTDTSVTLSSYHYSTNGFRTLNDKLSADYFAGNTVSETDFRILRQRSRFDITLSQNLNQYGNLGLSASRENYHNSGEKNDQLQLSWSKIFDNRVAVNLSVARMTNASAADGFQPDSSVRSRKSQNFVSLGISMPLGDQRYSPNISFSANHTRGRNDYQTNLSGLTGTESQPISYGLSYISDDRLSQGTISGSLQTQLPVTNLRVSAAKAPDYRQASAGAQGSLVLHRGGLTAGPYLSDTFAIVEAKGAQGAKVVSGGTVSSSGYALVPSLIPYQYNAVMLSSEGIDTQAEISRPEQKVAPYSGAMLRIKYDTNAGQPVLITLLYAGGKAIPMGSQVLNENDQVLGMTGQANQLYFRADKPEGKLRIVWGDGPGNTCSTTYRLPDDKPVPLVSMALPCQ
ncbi:TPA: fimbrial biogenesis outer membrane usher protein [Morganella morganii]|nr:fimbrial biogenesis outer membrane usher protein [Morganella morganii]